MVVDPLPEPAEPRDDHGPFAVCERRHDRANSRMRHDDTRAGDRIRELS